MALLIEYYSQLFTSSLPRDLKHIVERFQLMVLEEMRDALAKPYTSEEVGVAMKEMALLKAPGPDGMPYLFFQTYWTDVCMDITQAVLSCLNSSSILKSINNTFITLIPKVNNSNRVSDFRPISLCNVIYKIVSKVIANRLKPMLNYSISETQSAFVADRLITDNILIAFESLHHMKTCCTRNKGFMAMKLDMRKVYDRVKWSFLEKNPPQTGFSRFLGGFNYGVYFHSVLLYSCEWGTERSNLTIKRSKTRRSSFSLFVLVLCGRVKCVVL